MKDRRHGERDAARSADLRNDIAFGVVWFAIQFLYDMTTSYWVLKNAFHKVRHDPGASQIVAAAVIGQCTRMLGVYLLLGFVGGGFLYLLRRGFGATHARRWRFGLATLLMLWIWGRGAVLWPQMYYGGIGAQWLADYAEPWWFDAGALLALVAVGLRFRGRLSWAPLGLALVGGIAVAQLDRHPPAKAAQANAGPNVVLIGFDALRPDHLASFGYSRDTAPHLDRFLAESTVYTEAVTPLARTWPAWTSILTGADPPDHGERDSLPAIGEERPDVAMITDALVDAGVFTSFLTDDSRFSYMVPAHNFKAIEQPLVGIATFALSKDPPHFRPFFNFLNGPLGWALVPVYRYNQAMGITHRPDYFAERVADAIAEASRHDRFFLAAHFCLLHAPGDRSYPYDRMYGMVGYPGDNRFAYRSTGSEVSDDDLDGDDLLAAERLSKQQNLDLYDSGIAMIDETWVRIERALDEAHLDDNTIVIVLSDHGEDFLEADTRYKFRGPNHGFHPFGVGQSRVLLAVRAPGALQEAYAPGFRTGMVGLVDVAPTIAEIMGVPFQAPTGRSLASPPDESRLLFGETGVSERSYWAPGHKHYSFRRPQSRYTVDRETRRVYQRPQYRAETVRAKDRWVADGTFWLTEEALEDGPRYRLFRWHDDPTFGNDVAADYPEDFARLVAALQARSRGGPHLDLEEDPPPMAGTTDARATGAAPPSGG